MDSGLRSWLGTPVARFVLMIVATILFNFGLFFILNFLAPLITGIIIGFLNAKIEDGVVVSFTGTLISYFILFTISEWIQGFNNAAIDIAIAILIMASIGSIGGALGSMIATKAKN